MACAAPEANTAPPAPALIAGRAGIEPAVIRIALMMLMALGCSLVMNSSALQAFKSQTGARVIVVTAESAVLDRDGVGGFGVPLEVGTPVSEADFGGGEGRLFDDDASSLPSLEFFLAGQKSEPALVGVRRIGAGRASSSSSFEPRNDELEREGTRR